MNNHHAVANLCVNQMLHWCCINLQQALSCVLCVCSMQLACIYYASMKNEPFIHTYILAYMVTCLLLYKHAVLYVYSSTYISWYLSKLTYISCRKDQLYVNILIISTMHHFSAVKCLHVFVCICVCLCLCVCVCICAYLCIRMSMYVCVCLHVFVCKCVGMCMYVCPKLLDQSNLMQ